MLWRFTLCDKISFKHYLQVKLIAWLHDAVGTYARTIFPTLLGFFCTALCGEKKMTELSFNFIAWFEISAECEWKCNRNIFIAFTLAHVKIAYSFTEKHVMLLRSKNDVLRKTPLCPRYWKTKYSFCVSTLEAYSNIEKKNTGNL